jgi:DNA-binding transcriptional MerR regulator
MQKRPEDAGDAASQRTLSALSAETGFPERTIRYYIARGLLPGPVRGGRGAAYTEEHLERLEAIRQLQAKGLMLTEIARALGGGEERLPEPAACLRYRLAEDVTVEVRAGAAPWRVRQIQAALAALAARLAGGDRQTQEQEDSLDS